MTEIPDRVWAGDESLISVRVEFDESLPITDNTLLVGKYEASIEDVNPRGEVRLTLKSSQPVTFKWQIRPVYQMDYPGTLWLWIEGDSGKELLLARDFTISSCFLMGTQILFLRIGTGLIGLAGLMILVYSYIKRK